MHGNHEEDLSLVELEPVFHVLNLWLHEQASRQTPRHAVYLNLKIRHLFSFEWKWTTLHIVWRSTTGRVSQLCTTLSSTLFKCLVLTTNNATSIPTSPVFSPETAWINRILWNNATYTWVYKLYVCNWYNIIYRYLFFH